MFAGQEGLDDEALTALIARSESEGKEAPLTAMVRITVPVERGDIVKKLEKCSRGSGRGKVGERRKAMNLNIRRKKSTEN